MGISNAPPVFQRYVNNSLRGLLDRICAAYLDDILIYGRSFEEHLQNFQTVLQRLRAKGIRLRADKCAVFQKEVRYLGRLVSKNGHPPDPGKTQATLFGKNLSSLLSMVLVVFHPSQDPKLADPSITCPT